MDIGNIRVNLTVGSDYLLKILQGRIETFFQNYSLQGCEDFEAHMDKKYSDKVFISPRAGSSIKWIVEKEFENRGRILGRGKEGGIVEIDNIKYCINFSSSTSKNLLFPNQR